MKTITVAAPLCAPARYWTEWIPKRLAPYHPGASLCGVRAVEINKSYIKIDVIFSDNYVEWGEYILLRLGFQPLGRLLNPKNKVWAQHYLDLAAAGASWATPGCGKKQKNSYEGGLAISAPPPPWKSHSRKSRPWRGILDWLEDLLP